VGIGNRSYNDRVVPVSDGRINGVNITALNARTRTSAASTNAAISSWTTRTAPSNDWVSVCWSPELSLFVATSYAGTGNRIMTSTDGITWISQTSAADNIWWSVCWSSKLSLFVTVSTTGTGNRVMTSSNGINWSTRVSAADNNWNSVCWSDELTLFVSVAYSGTGNRVMTSSNGINWVTRASSVDSYWQSVCWAPELSMFIAVGYSTVNRGVMTSDNGINWITQVSTANNFWNTICWSSELSLFVTYSNSGTGNRIMTSSNGSSWTTRNSTADIDWRCVTWSPELSIFCAVAYTGASHRIAVSYDGIIWTSRSSALSPFQFICWAPELSIFAVSANAALTMTSAIGMPNSKSVVKALPSQMMVSADGNVGIGTTNPLAKLHVNGRIFCPGMPIQTQYYFLRTTTSIGDDSINMSTYNPGINISITPLFATSVIKITLNTTMSRVQPTFSLQTELWKNGSALVNSYWGYILGGGSGVMYVPMHLIHYDTSISTATITYSLRLQGKGLLCHPYSNITFTAEEIAQ
jgi:hypothetical protein